MDKNDFLYVLLVVVQILNVINMMVFCFYAGYQLFDEFSYIILAIALVLYLLMD